MAKHEHFEVGMAVKVKLSTGQYHEGVIYQIRTGKAAYPFTDRTILDTVSPQGDGQRWKPTWWSAEDPDVHPHPDPDWHQAEFVKHMLMYGEPPYDA